MTTVPIQTLGLDVTPRIEWLRWPIPPVPRLPFLALTVDATARYRLNPDHSCIANPEDPDDSLDPRFKWWSFAPASGGTAMHRHGPFFVIPLEPTTRTTAAMAAIHSAWFASGCACGDNRPDNRERYRAQLTDLLGADHTGGGVFEEALYPIDWNSVIMPTLTTDSLPAFSSLITHTAPIDAGVMRAITPHEAIAMFRLFIFDENSD